MKTVALVISLVLIAGCSKKNAKDVAPEKGHAKHEGHAEHEEGEDDHEGEEDHEEGLVELSEAAAANVRIRVQAVERRSLSGLISTTGTVDFDPDRVAHIGARLAGRLHETKVELGAQVAAGQVLAIIDSVELGKLKSEYLQANARFDLAKQNLEREEKLAEERITSKQSVLTARAEMLEQQATLRAAEASLRLSGLATSDIEKLEYGPSWMALYPIRAPFAGTIIEKHLTRGELISADKDILTLVDLSRVWVWIDVYERDIANVHVGDEARLHAAPLGKQVLTGTVTFIRPQVDPKTRRIGARVEVANPGGALKSGMFVRVELRDPHGKEGEAERASVLVVPESALLREAGSEIVFVETEPRHYKRHTVRVGARAEGHAEIVEGLDEGDKVVVEGAPILKGEASKEAMGGGHSH